MHMSQTLNLFVRICLDFFNQFFNVFVSGLTFILLEMCWSLLYNVFFLEFEMYLSQFKKK